MPSPRRRSRDRRSRSRSRQRRSPPRRSRSRSPRRRSRSPRRSRTHSPHRRPIRRSRSRTRRSFSPRHRRSPSPKGHPRRPPPPPPPPPRRRSSGRRSPGRRSLSPRGGYSQRRSHSPRGRPQGRRSPRRSPKRVNSGQRQSPHSSTDAKRVKSRSPYKELSPVRRESPPNYKGRSPSPQLSPRVHHKNDLLIGGITVNTPIKRLMLTDRFQTEEQRDQGDIVIEDNIVIAIQRGLNVVNSSPVEINREFDPDNVVIIRQKDEGKTPIFDREEIKMFGFDSMEDDNAVEEKRIISVIPQSRRHKSPEVIRKIKQKQKVQLDFRPDPKYEPLIKYRGIKGDDEEKETYRIKRVEKNPNDLRHSLSKRRHDDGDRFDARKKIDARRGSDLGQREGERVFARLGDNSRERKRERSREKRPERLTSGRSRDSRSSRDRKDKSDGKNLPDFKNRPDKFKYEEWKEKPEMIPRNPSYFEHDNREGERGFRGRGRGFRGRPPPRGSYRGRGGFGGSFRGGFGGGFKGGRGGSSLRDREWKHDLFDKLKDDEEEKPSSTTKN